MGDSRDTQSRTQTDQSVFYAIARRSSNSRNTGMKHDPDSLGVASGHPVFTGVQVVVVVNSAQRLSGAVQATTSARQSVVPVGYRSCPLLFLSDLPGIAR